MIFKPEEVFSMWDTWLYHHDGTYYLYFLTMGPTERQGWHGQGVAMATSPDGVHWDEIGVVLPKDDGATGLGTGSVWKSADFETSGKFVMNYSTWFDWCIQSQSIRFAESTDLIHWTKLGAEGDFPADPRWYETYPEFEGARWDCIYTVPRAGGGRYGYWTALPNGRPGFGFGETLDGAHWTVLEPPLIEGTGQGEVGAVEQIDGKYYMLYHGGGLTLVADDPQGPFRPVPKNRVLLGGNAYFARFLRTPDALLVNHHSIPRGNGVPDGLCRLGLLKSAVVDGEGALRLRYWGGNERLKGERIEIEPLEEGAPGSFAHLFANTFDVDAGVVIEGLLPLTTEFESGEGAVAESSRVVRNAAMSGLYVEYAKGQGAYFVVGADGLTEIGLAGAGGSFLTQECLIDREMSLGQTAAFRILLKDSLLEFYLDDMLIQVYSLPSRATGRVGLIGCAAEPAGQCRAWGFC